MASLNEFRIAGDSLSLFDLPNEVCLHVLDLLPTLLLLQSRSVCHRFQNLIIRIVHGRLLRAASLTDRELILECYHPSAQYTEPYLYCDYLATPGLSVDQPTKGTTLGRLYSHFRPTRKNPETKIYRSHPAGDVPGSRTSEVANRIRETVERKNVTQNVSLEAHELFMQLRFLVAVVQTGPHRGFFLSVENLIDKTRRIFRNWLAERAEATKQHNKGASGSVTDELDYGADEVLWVDESKVAGLKVRVEESKGRRGLPILLHKDEDQAVRVGWGEGNSQAMIFGTLAIPNRQQIEETPGDAVF
ncbi:MAG: hypothetical protein ASARMPRED_007564 [Alectoria sarmentosa]|nr:MAG: hypothetical protein ASARMPRED_007564 [Alectoria sarmentosa]